MENTLIEKEKITRINFLDFTQKCCDWRYHTYSTDRFADRRPKTIYWIGILDLSQYDEEKNSAPLSFIDKNCELIQDKYFLRDKDGTLVQGTPPRVIYYDLSDEQFKKALLFSKEKGNKFQHFFIEEMVNDWGGHRVSVIFRPNLIHEPFFDYRYGFSSKVCLVEDSLKFSWIIELSKIEVMDTNKRITIKINNPYRWLK